MTEKSPSSNHSSNIEKLKTLASDTAFRFKVDPLLLIAIMSVESGFNPWVMRYEPKSALLVTPGKFALICSITGGTEILSQRVSWGLCQVLGATARDLGYKLVLSSLCDPLTNLELACQYLRRLGERYTDTYDIAAAYNAGSVRRDGNGDYINYKYTNAIASARARHGNV